MLTSFKSELLNRNWVAQFASAIQLDRYVLLDPLLYANANSRVSLLAFLWQHFASTLTVAALQEGSSTVAVPNVYSFIGMQRAPEPCFVHTDGVVGRAGAIYSAVPDGWYQFLVDSIGRVAFGKEAGDVLELWSECEFERPETAALSAEVLQEITQLEKAVGVTFEDGFLLAQAFTHPSLVAGSVESNQRLEVRFHRE